MRILVATSYLPWPMTTGGNAAQFATLKCLARDHQFVVVALIYSSDQRADLTQLQRALPDVRFIVVETWKQQQGIFSVQFAVKMARKIYTAAKALSKSQNSGSPATPYFPFHSLPAKFIQVLNEELRKGVDIFQAEFAEMLPLGAWLPQSLPKLFVHHQVHFRYAQRFIETKGDANGYGDFLVATMRAQEIAFLKYFDTIVTFSHDDSAALKPFLNGTTIETSPFPLPSDLQVAEGKPVPSNGTFCFLASEEHFPNRDALAWLLGEIWPRISGALPSAKLNVVGVWSGKTQKALSGPKINFTGFVPDLSPIMKGSILLVPVRIGSGIRVKILAALALGVPVVTTTIGGEGLNEMNDKGMLTRDGADEFAAAAIRLTQDNELWQSMCIAGRNAVQANYSAESVRIRRNQIYDRLLTAN